MSRSPWINRLYDYLRYRRYVLRISFKSSYAASREYLANTSVMRIIGERFIDRLSSYSFVLVSAVLQGENTGKNDRLVRDYIMRCHQRINNVHDIRDIMRHSLQIGERELTADIYDAAEARGLKTAPSEYKHACLAKRDTMAHIRSFRLTSKKKWVRRYFPEKTVADEDIEKVLHSGENIGIITTLGPGDEAAFSTNYSALIEDPHVDTSKIKILCDHRLHSLLKRSFPQFQFVPSRRSRYITADNTYHLYNKLPAFGMHVLMCNESIGEMTECAKFIYMHDLAYVYTDYLLNNTLKRRYLPSEALRKKYKSCLPENTRLVGIVWRSALSGISRDINYFSIEQLSPIFDIPGLKFVNLQYNNYEEDVAWVEERWPGKLITFEDVDMYNDFDSVVAIQSCLESVITPPTMISHLSAQSGCKTLLLANTLEVTMRCRSDGRDLWHRNMVHISGDTPGDRKSLVKNLVDHLVKQPLRTEP